MLRDFRVADLFTLLNAFAGMGAILSFMRYCVEARMESFWLGTGLLPAALVMDVLDGRVARSRGEQSPLGQELDSLAEESRIDRLCELNVAEQVANVCHTTVVRDAWARGQDLTVHGLVYGLQDGLLRDLGVSVSAAVA